MPNGRIYLIWSTINNLLYLVQIILDTFIIAYHMKPLRMAEVTTA